MIESTNLQPSDPRVLRQYRQAAAYEEREYTVIDSSTPWYKSKIIQSVGAVFLGAAVATALALPPVGLPILACIGIGAVISAIGLSVIFAAHKEEVKVEVPAEQAEPQEERRKLTELELTKLSRNLPYYLGKVVQLTPELARMNERSVELDGQISVAAEEFYDVRGTILYGTEEAVNLIKCRCSEKIRQIMELATRRAWPHQAGPEDLQPGVSELKAQLAKDIADRETQGLETLKAARDPLDAALAEFNSFLLELEAELSNIIASARYMDSRTLENFQQLIAILPE